jgi:hypothetical protein
MAQPVKGPTNPPHSEPQPVQPTTTARKPPQKPATPPPQQDTVKISSAARAANSATKSQKPD